MVTNFDAELLALDGMAVSQLRQRYAEVFGEPARSFNKQHLVKRIAWRVQALQEGDLTERARRRARELARDADLRIRPPATPELACDDGQTATIPFRVPTDDRLPMVGALLTREYKGQKVRVRVLQHGFEFEGEIYRSLTAVAKAATGAHWNGYHFFGLAPSSKEFRGS